MLLCEMNKYKEDSRKIRLKKKEDKKNSQKKEKILKKKGKNFKKKKISTCDAWHDVLNDLYDYEYDDCHASPNDEVYHVDLSTWMLLYVSMLSFLKNLQRLF